jgi:hypothetical protein
VGCAEGRTLCSLENLEEACMCFSPLRRVGWVAGPCLEGGQVAVLHLHVMALAQIAIV